MPVPSQVLMSAFLDAFTFSLKSGKLKLQIEKKLTQGVPFQKAHKELHDMVLYVWTKIFFSYFR